MDWVLVTWLDPGGDQTYTDHGRSASSQRTPEPCNQQAAVNQCLDCGGSGTVENPLGALWWKRHDDAERAWKTVHPEERWAASADYAELDAHSPGAGTPAEEPCPSCEGRGDADHLIAAVTALHEVTNSIDDSVGLLAAAERWRDNGWRPADGAALQQRLATVMSLAVAASRVLWPQTDRQAALSGAQHLDA